VAACRAYLIQQRWPDGFRCPRCGHPKGWPVRELLFQCSACGRQSSVTAGTIFQDTRTPLPVWFRAMWCVTSHQSEDRDQRPDAAAGPGPGQLPDRVGMAAQAASGDGATGARAPDPREQDPHLGASVRQVLSYEAEPGGAEQGQCEPQQRRELPDPSPQLQDLLSELRLCRSAPSRQTTAGGAAPSNPRAVERGTPRSVVRVTSPVRWTRCRRRS
jgi:hypothetical protein